MGNRIRGTVEVETGKGKKELYLTFDDLCKLESDSKASVLKIAKNLEQNEIALDVVGRIMDLAAKESGFAKKMMDERGYAELVRIAVEVLYTTLAGKAGLDAEKEREAGGKKK